MDLTTGLTRTQEIRHNTSDPGNFVKQRLARNAGSLDLAGSVAMHCSVINECLFKVVDVLYTKDSDGVWANVDCVTHRLLIPTPWGNAGWQRWGMLRRWEASVVSSILIERSTQPRATRPALFDYNEHSRRWHLNLNDYGSIGLAQRFLEKEPISLADWRKHNTMCLASTERRRSKQQAATG